MAIVLEFIDLVVPIEVIRTKYPGGWDWCLRDHAALIGGRVWYDDHFFRDGAMNPNDIKVLVDRWAELGFEVMGSRDGRQFWKDVCMVEAIFGGATLPCEWLMVDTNQRIAYLKGTDAGRVVGRDEMVPREDA